MMRNHSSDSSKSRNSSSGNTIANSGAIEPAMSLFYNDGSLPPFVLPSFDSESSPPNNHDRDNYMNDLLKAGFEYESKLGLLGFSSLSKFDSPIDEAGVANHSNRGPEGNEQNIVVGINNMTILDRPARSSPISTVETVFFDKDYVTIYNSNDTTDYGDWNTNQTATTASFLLPPLVSTTSLLAYNDKSSGGLRLSKAAQAWIQIIQCMTTECDDEHDRSPPSTTSKTDLHDEVYLRMAQLLVGLVSLVGGGGGISTVGIVDQKDAAEELRVTRTDASGGPPPMIAAVENVDDNANDGHKKWIIQHSRSLAQQVLKQSRMKRHGAIDVYAWFTTFAAECSELLGDIHLAHLAYKSVDSILKRRRQTHHSNKGWSSSSRSRSNTASTTTSRDRNYAAVIVPPTPSTSPFPSHHKTIRGAGSSITKSKKTDSSTAIKDNTVGEGRMEVPTMTIKVLIDEDDSNDSPVIPDTAAASYSVGHHMTRRTTYRRASWLAYSILHPDSKVGNYLVPPGTLEERIHRTTAMGVIKLTPTEQTKVEDDIITPQHNHATEYMDGHAY
jgi:hypothetical protein